MLTKGVGYSVKGQRSEENEDSFVLLSKQDFYLVADGVGGGPRGRDASKIVVNKFVEIGAANLNRHSILNSIYSANSDIKKVAEEAGVRGMASTLSAVWCNKTSITVFHVGDSRVYRINKVGEINLLTNDHSKKLEDDRKSKNVITNAVGVREKIEVDVFDYNELVDEYLVLMSDGISDVVEDGKIAEIVSTVQLGLLEKCIALVHEADSRGGKDDKTVVIIAPLVKS